MPRRVARPFGVPGAEGISDAASRAAAIRSLLTQFGEVPEGPWDAYGDVDEATRIAARENPYSVLRTLSSQFEDALRDAGLYDLGTRRLLSRPTSRATYRNRARSLSV
jgi:hypothetical protein